MDRFIEEANTFHPAIKFTAEISENEITFPDTVVFKGERKINPGVKTHYKPTETFQYTHFTLCHPPGVQRGLIKGEEIRLLRTNSSKTTFEECLANFKRRFEARCQRSSLTQDNRLLNHKDKKRRRDFCLLSLHTTLQ